MRSAASASVRSWCVGQERRARRRAGRSGAARCGSSARSAGRPAPGPATRSGRRGDRGASASCSGAAWSTRRSAGTSRIGRSSLRCCSTSVRMRSRRARCPVGRSPRRGRPAQEEQGALVVVEDLRERLFLGDLRPSAQASLAAAEGLEDPEAEIVDEADERQPEALEQVVEAEEVEHRDRAHHVDDDARGGRLAHHPAPALVDAHVTEEAAIEPAQPRGSARSPGLSGCSRVESAGSSTGVEPFCTSSCRTRSASMGTSVIGAAGDIGPCDEAPRR